MEQRDEALGLRQQLAIGQRRAVVIPRAGTSRVQRRHAHRHRGSPG
jgi:hypothetical protein